MFTFAELLAHRLLWDPGAPTDPLTDELTTPRQRAVNRRHRASTHHVRLWTAWGRR